MSHLFAAVLLFSSPGCPHEELSCITPTEYIEVNLSLIASPQPLTASRAPGCGQSTRPSLGNGRWSPSVYERSSVIRA